MSKMKTEFELTPMNYGRAIIATIDSFGIKIMGKENELLSYMTSIQSERFAVNILKALKSKHLKQ